MSLKSTQSTFSPQKIGRVSQCLFLQKLFSPQILKHKFNVFKAHRKLQFSTQKLSIKPNSICLHNPPQSKVSTQILKHFQTACLFLTPNKNTVFPTHSIAKVISICVFKTHHNLQFSPQIQKYKFKQCLWFQNPPQSSVLTTNAKA